MWKAYSVTGNVRVLQALSENPMSQQLAQTKPKSEQISSARKRERQREIEIDNQLKRKRNRRRLLKKDCQKKRAVEKKNKDKARKWDG